MQSVYNTYDMPYIHMYNLYCVFCIHSHDKTFGPDIKGKGCQFLSGTHLTYLEYPRSDFKSIYGFNMGTNGKKS